VARNSATDVFAMIVTNSLILVLSCAMGSPAVAGKGSDNRNKRNVAETKSLREFIKPPWWIPA